MKRTLALLPRRIPAYILMISVALFFAAASTAARILIAQRDADAQRGKPDLLGQPDERKQCTDAWFAVSDIALGTIAAGGRAEVPIRLDNRSASWIEVARVETTCACITLELPQRRIPPRGAIKAALRLDLSRDRDFIGGLSPEIWGFDATGNCVFHRTARANIVIAKSTGNSSAVSGP